MSKSERKSDEIYKTWEIIYRRQRGKCALCDKPMQQLAHVIGQGDLNVARYGLEVIHHPDNIRGVCGLEHNAAVSISPIAKPHTAGIHVAKIRKKIEEEKNHADVGDR